MTELIIARHGNTFRPGDVVRRVGKTDLDLVESGLEQGLKLGAYLKTQHLIPDLIVTSTLKRTLQTAEQALIGMQAQPPIISLEQFNEIDYGPDENQPEEQVRSRLGEDALKTWEKDALVPNGWKVNPEDLIQAWQDFADFLKREHALKRCLVITSNGIARFAPYLTGNFQAFCAQHPIKLATGALGRFEHHEPNEYWRCLGWNIKP